MDWVTQYMNREEPVEELSFVLNSAIPGLSQPDYILLDGGASHDVSISPTIPKGSIEKEVKLAHGSKKGYVKDGCITLVDYIQNERIQFQS